MTSALPDPEKPPVTTEWVKLPTQRAFVIPVQITLSPRFIPCGCDPLYDITPVIVNAGLYTFRNVDETRRDDRTRRVFGLNCDRSGDACSDYLPTAQFAVTSTEPREVIEAVVAGNGWFNDSRYDPVTPVPEMNLFQWSLHM